MILKEPVMPNKFERQVQQKMEELNFSPSPPVWHHIESQIRNKKKQRSAFIWFALLFLLMGGSLWLRNASHGKLTAIKTGTKQAGIGNNLDNISTTTIKPKVKEVPDIS